MHSNTMREEDVMIYVGGSRSTATGMGRTVNPRSKQGSAEIRLGELGWATDGLWMKLLGIPRPRNVPEMGG